MSYKSNSNQNYNRDTGSKVITQRLLTHMLSIPVCVLGYFTNFRILNYVGLLGMSSAIDTLIQDIFSSDWDSIFTELDLRDKKGNLPLLVDYTSTQAIETFVFKMPMGKIYEDFTKNEEMLSSFKNKKLSMYPIENDKIAIQIIKNDLKALYEIIPTDAEYKFYLNETTESEIDIPRTPPISIEKEIKPTRNRLLNHFNSDITRELKRKIKLKLKNKLQLSPDLPEELIGTPDKTSAIPKTYPNRYSYFNDLLSATDMKFFFGISIGRTDYEINYLDFYSLLNALINGTISSGKTSGLEIILSQCVAKGYFLAFLDQKEGADYEFLQYYPKCVTASKTGEMETLVTQVKLELSRRNQLLSKHKCNNSFTYTRKTGKKLTPLILIVEEYAQLAVKECKDLRQLIENIGALGRSANVFVVIVTQHGDSKIIPTSFKNNLQNRIVYAMETTSASGVSLDNRSDKRAYYLSERGRCYFKKKGRYWTLAQTFFIEHENYPIILKKYLTGEWINLNNNPIHDKKQGIPVFENLELYRIALAKYYEDGETKEDEETDLKNNSENTPNGFDRREPNEDDFEELDITEMENEFYQSNNENEFLELTKINKTFMGDKEDVNFSMEDLFSLTANNLDTSQEKEEEENFDSFNNTQSPTSNNPEDFTNPLECLGIATGEKPSHKP